MSMQLHFTKLSATGNDFIMFDNREYGLSETDRAFFQHICKRRTSVGADGVLLFDPSSDDQLDFVLRYFNADGSETECGNGARAAAFFSASKGVTAADCRFAFGTSIYEAQVADDHVRLKFPPPRDLQGHLEIVEETSFKEAGSINTGVPHYVLFGENIKALDVENLGRKYRHHPRFQPHGSNVNFVEMKGDEIEIRTYERGVEAETLACGTGAVACAFFTNTTYGLPFPIKICTQGGLLTVDKDREGCFYLTGQVENIYQGVLNRTRYERQD